MNKKVKGFSLIEVMVVVVIIAIISAFAYPAYRDKVTKSRRVDAQGALMGLSSAMERYYTQNNSYLGATLGVAGIFPNEAPLDGSAKYYNLSIDAVATTATAYTILATPKSNQAGNGRLQLNSVGTRFWNSKDDGTGVDTPW